MRIGLMTGGGDAPGLNGVLEAVGKSLLGLGYELVGIHDGFEGIFENKIKQVTKTDLSGMHARAGTFLGTSNRCGTVGREQEFLEKYQALDLKGIIVAGGDGTFAGLQSFGDKISLIGVPKTIDNDLSGTEVTFGYDTACSVVSEAVDALRATADAHRRCLIIETMGRTAGWIALGGGMASYADMILIPERPYCSKDVLDYIRLKKTQQRGLVIVVSEGAKPKDGEAEIAFHVKDSPQKERFGGIANKLAQWIEEETDWESRQVVLGHLQRCKAPTPTDRFLTLAMGVQAAKLVLEEKWGSAVVYRQGRIQDAPITDLMQPARLVDSNHRWIKMAQSVGIYI